MADSTKRALRLLGLLQARTTWQAHELAERLDVTERTVRRDITRLRALGYPVDSERGIDGGYRLGTGRHLPALLLDEDEVIALVACLRMAALQGSDHVGEAALRSLTKLSTVIPSHLRALLTTIDDATHALPGTRSAVDITMLQNLAQAQRGHNLVRFTYRKPNGKESEREVEPARLMTQGEHWYLQAFDRRRQDWRVFRLDRIADLRLTTWQFIPRSAPPAEMVSNPASRYPCTVRVEIAASEKEVRARVPAPYLDECEETESGCRFRVGASQWDLLAWHLLWISRDLGEAIILPDPPDSELCRAALSRISADALEMANAVHTSSL